MTNTRTDTPHRTAARPPNPVLAWEPAIMRAGVLALVAFLVVAIALPLATLLLKSFQSADGHFVGLANYARYFATPQLVSSLWNSVWVSVVATSIVVPLAFGYAYALTRTAMPGKPFFAGLALLPNQGFTGGGGDEAVERTRKQTRMLDDLYKTAIVLITEHYVKGDEPAAAAVAGKLLWKEMKAKGHHEVRLLDATGEPNEASNVATDDFEKSALKEIIAGQSSVERVVEKSGKRFLRTATAVPVVMTKCVACHPHYAKVPKGQAIGTLVYTLPVE